MELKLATYVYNCRAATEGTKTIGIATDEASVKALPLQVTVMTTSGNTGILCCPMVTWLFFCPFSILTNVSHSGVVDYLKSGMAIS